MLRLLSPTVLSSYGTRLSMYDQASQQHRKIPCFFPAFALGKASIIYSFFSNKIPSHLPHVSNLTRCISLTAPRLRSWVLTTRPAVISLGAIVHTAFPSRNLSLVISNSFKTTYPSTGRSVNSTVAKVHHENNLFYALMNDQPSNT